jgi:mono/diheme cytochrome c family protein
MEGEAVPVKTSSGYAMVVLLSAAASACSGAGDPAPAAAGPWSYGASLPAEPQEPGDPVLGQDLLVNGGYMTCGVPYKLWADATIGPLVRSSLGSGSQGEPLPGRTGRNADLPFGVNAFVAADGAEVVNANCISCHGGKFDGDLIVGLGNASADYTSDRSTTPTMSPELLGALGLSTAEQDHMRRILRLANVFGPELVMRTVGNNPAEALTVLLMLHHDRDTLAWSDEPLGDFTIRDARGNPIPDPIFTSDPPPWWRAHKKHALFYNGMARGDHRGTMAMATSVCVDNVAEAERVDDMFKHIQAYITTLRAPRYKRAIDGDLALEGKAVFVSACAGCHGTYATDPEDDGADTYPNLLLPLDVVGTDTVLANGGVVHAPEMVDWYNASYYGRITRLVVDDPFPGYVAPPLDGVWATGPFLHNGSVPTIELVLNSKARPRFWKRVDYDDTNFDEDALGWPWIEMPYGQAEAPEAERKYIYDTTYFSQSNAGHTFGDHLSVEQRRAVIEYLKTL